MTGFYPYNHGARVFGQKPSPEFHPFINELAQEGYTIKTEFPYFSELFPNFSHFDINHKDNNNIFSKFRYISNKAVEVQYIMNVILGNRLPFLFGKYCFGISSSMMQTSRLLRTIRLNRNKKWFFWTHFVNNCHWPYGAPPYFVRLYDKNMESIKTSWSMEKICWILLDWIGGIKIQYIVRLAGMMDCFLLVSGKRILS